MNYNMIIGIKEDDTKKKKKSRKHVEKRLSNEQKLDIATTVHDHINYDIENERKNSEKMIDTLKAVIEEADMRIHEIKRDAFEFKRDVVMLGNSPASFRPDSASYTMKPGTANSTLRSASASKKGPKTDDSSEANNIILNDKMTQDKLIKYLNDKETQIDTTMEKLKLKNVTLKNQIYKVEQQLEQKEENNDTLQYIDFHQLQIENKQNVIKIAEKNEELITLKQSTNRTIQILNDLKSALKNKNDEVLWINTEIQTKEKVYSKLKHEQMRSRKSVDVQNMKLEKLLKNLTEMQMMNSVDLASTEIGEGEEYNLSLTRTTSVAAAAQGTSTYDNNKDEGEWDGMNLESSSVYSNHNTTDKGLTSTAAGGVSMQSSKSSVTTAASVTINDLPSTQDYILQKKLMYEYQEGIRNMERKLEILELAAKNLNIKTF